MIKNHWLGWADKHVCRRLHLSIFHEWSFAAPIGRLRLVGSLKLYVTSAKESYKRVYILQNRPRILRSLLIVATPYAFLPIHRHFAKRRNPHEQLDSYTFAKEPYKRDYILQKRPVIWRSLLIEATPYTTVCLSISYLVPEKVEDMMVPPKDAEIALCPSTNGSIPDF